MNSDAQLLPAEARPGPVPDPMVARLLALNEEMAAQFHRERSEGTGVADFLTGMIVQHENVAAMLRARLESLQFDSCR
jgi:hypothetical protein